MPFKSNLAKTAVLTAFINYQFKFAYIPVCLHFIRSFDSFPSSNFNGFQPNVCESLIKYTECGYIKRVIGEGTDKTGLMSLFHIFCVF